MPSDILKPWRSHGKSILLGDGSASVNGYQKYNLIGCQGISIIQLRLLGFN